MFAVLFSLALAAAAARTPVTLSGCAREGTTPGTFLLMNLHLIVDGREQPVPTDKEGRDVLYALSTSKGLEDGQRVEVIGTLDVGNREDAQLKVTKSSAKRPVTTSEITTEDGQVTVLTAGASPSVLTGETPRTIYRLKVKTIRAQGPCHSGWVTLAAPAEKP